MREVGMSRAPSTQVCAHILSQIPTTFGRLVYLVSLRDPNTGIYRHFGVAQQFGEEEAGEVLSQSHMDVFNEWLSFTLEQRKADLDCYLSGIPGDRAMILDTWLRLPPYHNLIPATAQPSQRDFYLSDLKALIALLLNVRAGVLPAPDA